VLTKPLGTGLVTTAAKGDETSGSALGTAVRWMSTLNKRAAEALASLRPHAVTDVTGFGLLGHLREMAAGSGVNVQIDHQSLPIIDGAADLATGGTVPGGSVNNRTFVEPHVDWDDRVSETSRILACDAQTSGGLLAVVPDKEVSAAVTSLHDAGVKSAVVVGRFTDQGPGRIAVQ
jgi:selenide,water dikinase